LDVAYYCYLVECANGAYYAGWTLDPLRRVREHNSGKGARYTRLNSPVRLVYVEQVPDRVSAMKRELQIKRLGHSGKQKLANSAEGNLVGEFMVPEAGAQADPTKEPEKPVISG
jgi:putative endonuclease